MSLLYEIYNKISDNDKTKNNLKYFDTFLYQIILKNFK
jgi:hypothetical protein